MKNLNKCPVCNHENSIELYVDAMDYNYPEESEAWDSQVYFKISPELIVADCDLPSGVVVCDKDRYLVCQHCGIDSLSDSHLDNLHRNVKLKNPGWM